jgi:hypothetical protein
VFLNHWHAKEAEDLAAALRDAGHDVAVHWTRDSSPPLTDPFPDLVVISLERLPSHGRAVAEWLWEAKKRRHIPIIFADGEPAKLAVTRAKFPNAKYCSTVSLVSEIMTVSGSGIHGDVSPRRAERLKNITSHGDSPAKNRSSKRPTVTVLNINVPGYSHRVDAVRYDAMKTALLKVLPRKQPGMTQAEMFRAVLPHLPEDEFPGGAKAAWWAKTVQLDLEAKGIISRDREAKPLRWYRAAPSS